MDAATESKLSALFRSRLRAQKAQIQHSLKQIAAGNPLGAEPRVQRLVARISSKAKLAEREAQEMADAVAVKAERIDTAVAQHADAAPGFLTAVIARSAQERMTAGAESLQGPSIDFVGVEFLTRGRLAANAVGRVRYQSGRPWGSGFLVGPGLFLTNNHVIPDADAARQMVVEFDYERDAAGQEMPPTTFALDPDTCFIHDPTEQLDFTLVGVGSALSGTKSLGAFGFNPLSDANDKHALGELANIVQHPLGERKQLVLRENSLISRDETAQVLHYLADTDKGASGSPVCNNEWEPIALHHWGEPALEVSGLLGEPLWRDVNEGIRISAIVRSLRARIGTLQGAHARSLSGLMGTWENLPRTGPVGPIRPLTVQPRQEHHTMKSDSKQAAVDQGFTGQAAFSAPRVEVDGTVTWTLPIEVSVRMPWGPPPSAGGGKGLDSGTHTEPHVPDPKPKAGRGETTDDLLRRGGYEPGFLAGHVVPLPQFAVKRFRLAKNRLALPGDDEHELRYYHFSIVMNAERRVAAFTACNIDGKQLFAVNREDKTTKPNPTPKDAGVESLEGAEASDDFRTDPRVLDSEQMGREFYEKQKVPGYEMPPNPGPNATPEQKKAYSKAVAGRTARMFQKGHITLRGDPAWGMTSQEAVLAEADTFFYTNAAPQLGFFNQGSPENQPSAKGKLRWRAVESYVLRNAITMRERLCVFAGPVFDDAYDVEYRFGVKVPMKFWKVVVWKAADDLRSIALLADQKPVLEKLTQGVPESMEAFEDEEELARVGEFLSTVATIERLTGLSFGEEVRQADVRSGAESASVLDFPRHGLAPVR